MLQNIAQVLQEADRFLQAGEYERAYEVLSLIEPDLLSNEARGEFHLLRGEVRLFLNDLENDDAELAVQVFRLTAEHSKYAKAKFLQGWRLLCLGESMNAREALSEAFASYMRAEDKAGAARTLNKMSRAAFQQGDLSYTLSILDRSAALYRDLGEKVKATTVVGNVALTLFRSGEIRQSMSVYAKVERDLSTLPCDNRVAVGLGHAIALAVAGDVARASHRIKKVLPELGGLGRENAIYHEYLGWIHLLARNYAKAEEALTIALEFGLKMSPVNDHISQSKRLLGDLCVATERWDEARQYAEEALEVAEQITERLEIAACHRIFAQVDTQRGHTEDARKWYREAIDLFNRIGARYEVAVTRMLAGASDLYDRGQRMALLYLAKEYFESEDLKHLVTEVNRHLAAGKAGTKTHRADTDGAPTIIAASGAMRKLVDFADHIARCDMTVLLTGETGTGKDLFARYIHHASGRTGQFVAVNAAAIPTSMIEAELFGHHKGAFTGASNERVGLFEQADGGTFYLNEIGDASPEFQTKLLEVLDTHTVRRLGQNQSRTVNFRLIAATNHDLQQRLKDGLFRLDLFHRLKEIAIALPPLSTRMEDLPGLVTYFMAELNGQAYAPGDLTRLAVALAARPWPGNVRELKAAITELHMSSGGNIERMIELALFRAGESEDDRLLRVLNATGWNRSRAAEVLGISEGAIRHRISKLGLDDPQEDDPLSL